MRVHTLLGSVVLSLLFIWSHGITSEIETENDENGIEIGMDTWNTHPWIQAQTATTADDGIIAVTTQRDYDANWVQDEQLALQIMESANNPLFMDLAALAQNEVMEATQPPFGPDVSAVAANGTTSLFMGDVRLALTIWRSPNVGFIMQESRADTAGVNRVMKYPYIHDTAGSA